MRIPSLMFAAALLLATPVHADESAAALLQRAQAHRQRGDDNQAAPLLRQALALAGSTAERQHIAALLGATLIDLRQLDEAEKLLHQAAEAGSARARAQTQIDLGNLKLRQKRRDEARANYRQAMAHAANAPDLRWMAELNLAAMDPPTERLPKLKALADRLPAIADAAQEARLAASLGAQAATLGAPGQEIAWRAYDTARQRAQAAKNARRLAEAYDGLAQLYEAQGQAAPALQLTELGVASAQQDNASDLLIGLEARRGRLLRAAGKADAARAAYGRSVEYIQQLRHAIPVEYQNGRSSFRDTLEPIYQELADLLLQKGAAESGDEQQQLYRQARDTLETLKQAELDDYLGDRCVPAAASSMKLDPGTAVLYPVLLKDRVDLLVETPAGMYRGSTPIAGDRIRKDAALLAMLMRDGEVLGDAPRALYDVLLRPVDGILAAQKIDTLIVVPDGPLRMIPFGALQDGKTYVVEKYAVAVVPGLSMLGQAGAVRGELHSLLAGMSEAGDVVKKLTPEMLAAISPEAESVASTRGLGHQRSTRNLEATLEASRGLAGQAEVRERALKDALALPGVKDEVVAIGKVTQGQTLLDGDFTLERFRQQVVSGQYRLVHIASHGVFGGSAEKSFILAHDDLIGLNALQNFLSSEALEASPIELLTLSACQTAQGNDRAPLGIAGADLKARAKAALGSLWPVSEEDAMYLMNTFYGALAKPGTSKVKALQQAQLVVMRKTDFDHPFFWAPFILVGNWQ